MLRSFLPFKWVVLATLNGLGLGFLDLMFLHDWLRCPSGGVCGLLVVLLILLAVSMGQPT